MNSKLSIVYISVAVGAAASLWGVFVTSIEVERTQQQDTGTSNGVSNPTEYSDDLSKISEVGEQPDQLQPGQNLTQTESPDATEAENELAGLDDKAISIYGKIGSEMDLVIDKLSEAELAIEHGDHVLASGYIEDARVAMSKVVGQQRQLLVIAEEGGQQPRLSDDGKDDHVDSQSIDSRLVRILELHLTIFEDIVEALDRTSNLVSESGQKLRIWTQDREDIQKLVAQLDGQYQEKVQSLVQNDLSILANSTQMKEDPLTTSITAHAASILQKIDALYKADLKSLESLEDVEESYSQSMYTSIEDLNRIEELREYALDKINEDRKRFGMPPVELSINNASQIHAEDIFRTGKLSHWLSNGEKPYMTYTKTGGSDSVFQNAAIGGYPSYQDCLSAPDSNCTQFDPYESIDFLEYEMVYNDVECCNDGHKYNIVDPHHNRVSIGIAYNDYFLVIVQNFENNYVDLDSPISSGINNDNSHGTLVNITGDVSQGYQIFGITINYDELPTRSIYDLNKDKNYYDGGHTIAVVQQRDAFIDYEKDLLLGAEYASIEATKWIEGNHGTFGIEFDLLEITGATMGVATKDGVYTITLWIQDEWDVIEAITYSVFVE
jgi:uncharacterized protein YkwD